jgi:hypothetical protein
MAVWGITAFGSGYTTKKAAKYLAKSYPDGVLTVHVVVSLVRV